MSRTKRLPVRELAIDLRNFRTVAQNDELEAIKAMISISPDYFWGLMDSILEDGYLPTENVIVIEDNFGRIQVKEGNRRVASLKIILGLTNGADLALPSKIIDRISKLPADWLDENSLVPCTIYKESEANIVDRIVTLTHGKGSKAGRDVWEAVARARHNRDKNGAAEVALDLLEKYLDHGTNVTQEQKSRWAGKFPLTVLDEAIKRMAPRFGVTSSPELVRLYPNVQYREPFDNIIHAIGMESLTFPAIRDAKDFALRFGLPPLGSSSAQSTLRNSPGASPSETIIGITNTSKEVNGTGMQRKGAGANCNVSSSVTNPSGSGTTSTFSVNCTPPVAKILATAINDERSVKKSLRALKLFGQSRAKVETLRKETLRLKLTDNPIAFCFLLRSMFEISAKAYCADRISIPSAPKAIKADGTDRSLADVLRDIVTDLTQNKKDMQMVRVLHGPLTEIQRHDGILSVTSMNQLVHNSSFTIQSGDIPVLFANIFPLLDHMNK